MNKKKNKVRDTVAAKKRAARGLSLSDEDAKRIESLAGKRLAYVVLESAFVKDQGWRLAICVEGEKGYYPTGTWPFTGTVGESRPIFVRGTYEDAQKKVDVLNERMGLTPKDAAILVASTF
jgi:hypothetical protein